jgi:hypothetical protein
LAIKDAFIFGFGLPPIMGLSAAGGFEFMLEDRAGGSIGQLAAASGALLDATTRHSWPTSSAPFETAFPSSR